MPDCNEKIFLSGETNLTHIITSPGSPTGYEADLQCNWYLMFKMMNKNQLQQFDWANFFF